MKKKKQFTLDEHKQFGEILTDFHDNLTHWFCRVAQIYGKSKQCTRYADRLLTALGNLKCEMDDILQGETSGLYYMDPKNYKYILRIYYGGLRDCEKQQKERSE